MTDSGAWELSWRADPRANAVAITRWVWKVVPPLGMITMIDAAKTRRKRDPGRCYRRAGFRHVGFTQGGLWVFQMLEDEMPEPLPLWETDTTRAAFAAPQQVISVVGVSLGAVSK